MLEVHRVKHKDCLVEYYDDSPLFPQLINLWYQTNGQMYNVINYGNSPLFTFISGSILRHSEDAGLVVLQAMSSERFLTINRKGELTTTVSICTFIHIYEDRKCIVVT